MKNHWIDVLAYRWATVYAMLTLSVSFISHVYALYKAIRESECAALLVSQGEHQESHSCVLFTLPCCWFTLTFCIIDQSPFNLICTVINNISIKYFYAVVNNILTSSNFHISFPYLHVWIKLLYLDIILFTKYARHIMNMCVNCQN